MRYEGGSKANCFSSAKSVIDFSVLVLDKCAKIYSIVKSIKSDVKHHSLNSGR